jgi:hypothetical protein
MSEPDSPFPSIPPPPSYGAPATPVPPPPQPGFGPRPFPPSGPAFGGTGPGGPAGFGGFGPGGSGGPSTRSGLAVAALVLGLLTLVLFWTLVVPVLAVVFGFVAASRIKHSGGMVTGAKMARAGWILGILGILGFVAIVIVAVASDDNSDVALDELDIGSCYDLPQSDDVLELTTLDEVPCDEPHRSELIHQYDMNPDRDRSYPGQDGAFTEAAKVCTGEVWTDYVGLEYDQSVYEVYVVIPVELNWKLNRGEASCFVVDADDGLLTDVVAGSGR